MIIRFLLQVSFNPHKKHNNLDFVLERGHIKYMFVNIWITMKWNYGKED